MSMDFSNENAPVAVTRYASSDGPRFQLTARNSQSSPHLKHISWSSLSIEELEQLALDALTAIQSTRKQGA